MKIENCIIQQPAIVEQCLAELPMDILAALPDVQPECIFFIGTGSSMNAFQAATHAFSRVSAHLYLRSPMTFLAEKSQRKKSTTLAIILSQSGQSSDTLAAAQQAIAEQMSVIVVTAGLKTPLAQLNVGLVTLPVQQETVGPKTMGFTASVIAIQLIGKLLTGEALSFDSQPFLMDYKRFIDASRDWSLSMTPTLREADVILILGQGRHLGTALEGSLKIAEMSGTPSFGLETEEASHGRLHGLTANSRTILLASSPVELTFAQRIQQAMGYFNLDAIIFDLAGGSIAVNPISFPIHGFNDATFREDTITAVTPFQWLGVHLAESRGMKPEAMTYPDMTARLGIKLDETIN